MLNNLDIPTSESTNIFKHKQFHETRSPDQELRQFYKRRCLQKSPSPVLSVLHIGPVVTFLIIMFFIKTCQLFSNAIILNDYDS